MRFSIVTPSLNRAKFLNETIYSVVSQEGNFEIEYIVQDGGSSEDVINILDYWEKEINSGRFIPRCNKLSFQWFSEKDSGMYDAINQGFSKATGEVMSWINTDDKYHSHAFEALTQIFSKYENVYWITGIPNSYNKDGIKVGMDLFPKSYSREFVKRGYYDVKFLPYGFNWIQQESTFWRVSLWQKVGGKLDMSKKYASDFYLWRSFAEHSDLVKVYSFLGGYRSHDEQITANPNTYRKELNDIPKPPKGLRILYIIIMNMPFLKKLFFNTHKGFFLFRLLGLKWEWLVGRVIEWSFDENKWVLRLYGIIE